MKLKRRLIYGGACLVWMLYMGGCGQRAPEKPQEPAAAEAGRTAEAESGLSAGAEDGLSAGAEDGLSEKGEAEEPEDGSAQKPEDGSAQKPEDRSAQKPEDGSAQKAEDGSAPKEEGTGAEDGRGSLSVSGTQLVDRDGSPVQLKGISTHGLAWYPEYVNAECFRQMKEEWGANVVRLAMYTAENGGYCTGGDQDSLKALVKDGVKYATDCGLYVIIDWHILSDGNPGTYLEEAEEFFREMSEEYADYENVLYEICNEPNGGTSWSQIKSYAEQVIPVIRENDEDGIILVGTPNWSQYVDQAAADPITGYDNIMYTLHFYAATHKDSLRDAMVKAVLSGLPVFVSEYGICDASGNGGIDVEQADKWVQTMDEHGISYVAWNLSNKAETSALLKSSSGRTSGFTWEDMSDSGKWLLGVLGGAGDGNTGGSGGVLAGNSGSEEAGSRLQDAGTGASSGQGSGTGMGSEQGSGTGMGSGQGSGTGMGSGTGTGSGQGSGTGVGSGQGSGTGTGSGQGSGTGTGSTGNETEPPWENTVGAATGEESQTSDNLTVSRQVVNSWEQNNESYYQYDVTITNSGDTAREGWKIILTFESDIALENGWNGIYQAEGNTLTITNMDYNGHMDAGCSVENIGFILKTAP